MSLLLHLYLMKHLTNHLHELVELLYMYICMYTINMKYIYKGWGDNTGMFWLDYIIRPIMDSIWKYTSFIFRFILRVTYRKQKKSQKTKRAKASKNLRTRRSTIAKPTHSYHIQSNYMYYTSVSICQPMTCSFMQQ